MYKNIVAVTLILLSLTITGKAQKLSAREKRAQARQLAQKEIKDLKGSVLLVRLQSKRVSADVLKKLGQNEQHDLFLLENKQYDYNKQIINAFRKHFNFCPVYFFFSDYSDDIRSKAIDKVVFLNDSLQPDPAIKFDRQLFFTAEFGGIEQDTSASNYPAGSEIRALVIKSDQFIRLARPFPFFVRSYDTFFIRRKPEIVVQLMNTKLQEFYTNEIHP